MTDTHDAVPPPMRDAARARFFGLAPRDSKHFFTDGYRVKTDLLMRRARVGAVLATALMLAACGTHPAKDYGGSWKPVNRFQDTPAEIPLTTAYTYYASPMDGTLKTMLTRWVTDSGMKLDYQLTSDYTLYKPVTQVHTTNVADAARELSAIYAAQGVSVTTTDHAIIVTQASATAANAGTK